MAIVLGNVHAVTTDQSYLHTVVAGNRSMLIWAGMTEGTSSAALSSVTYGGTALKRLSIASFTFREGGSTRYVYLYYLRNPPAGTATITATCSIGAVYSLAFDVSNVYGIRSLAGAEKNTASSPATSTITCTTDDTIPDELWSIYFKMRDSSITSFTDSQTSIYDNALGWGANAGPVAISKQSAAVGLSTTNSYTHSANDAYNDNYIFGFTLVPNPTATVISAANVSAILSGGSVNNGGSIAITGTTPNRSLYFWYSGAGQSFQVGSQIAKILYDATFYSSTFYGSTAATLGEIKNPSAGTQTFVGPNSTRWLLVEQTGGAHILGATGTGGSNTRTATIDTFMDNAQDTDPGAGALSGAVAGDNISGYPVGAYTQYASTLYGTDGGWSGSRVYASNSSYNSVCQTHAVCFHGAPLIYSETRGGIYGGILTRYPQEAMVVRDFLTDIYLTTQTAIGDPDKADIILISEAVTVTRPDPYTDITGVADKLKISEKIYIGLNPSLINVADALIVDEPYREVYLDPLDYGSTREPKSGVAITEDLSVKLYPMVWSDRSVPSMSWFGGSRPVPDSFPYYPLPSIAPVTSPPISVPSSDPYTGSASTFTNPATYRVHPVYVYPSDASYSADYFSAITSAMQNVQLWLYDTLGVSKTFSLVTVNSVQSSHPASYYASTANGNDSTLYYWNNARDELLSLVGASFWDIYDKWIFFLDAPASGQKTGSAYAVSLLHQAFIDGIRGVDTGYQGMPAYEANKWIGEIAHEVLHTLGLLHPAVQTTTSVMSAGYVLYPNCSIDTGTVYCEDDRYLNFVTELTDSPFMNATAI